MAQIIADIYTRREVFFHSLPLFVPSRSPAKSKALSITRVEGIEIAIQADTMSGDLLGLIGNSQLHGDLMMQIVSRLPVESVLRFKSVCRAWCALFNSRTFTQHHCRMARSSAKLNDLLFFFVHTNYYKRANPIFFPLVDRLYGERTSVLLNPPFECDLKAIHVVGSINGLVCLNFDNNLTLIVLWNPATRKYRRIPNPQLLVASREHDSLGFAYDDKTDTYKVIRILYRSCLLSLGEETYINRVEIYSTGTNTWRTIEAVDFPWFYSITIVTVVSGSPYWYGLGWLKEGLGLQVLMMWFDPSVEAFKFHPMWFEGILSDTIGFGAIGKHPVAYSESFKRGNDATVTLLDIWKLNKCDYGGRDPIYGEKLTIEFVTVLKLRTALGFTGNGEIIALSESGELYICDPRSTQYKHIYHRDAECGWHPKVHDYTESLVSPLMAA